MPSILMLPPQNMCRKKKFPKDDEKPETEAGENLSQWVPVWEMAVGGWLKRLLPCLWLTNVSMADSDFLHWQSISFFPVDLPTKGITL